MAQSRSARSALVVVPLALAACSSPPAAAPPEVSSAPHAAGVTAGPLVEERRAFPLPALPEAPRGLGTMTARLPGTSEVVGGVRLASHHARVTIEKGIAHTEIEEEFQNDTGRVLEGRLVFPLPADASLARLALWVGRDLVEGEVVEKGRADRIFRGIVDDTVRPRDPALLDVVAGGKVSLRIFPIPAHGARKVVFAYDEVLRRESGVLRYVHPLSLGGDRATPVGELSVTVDGVTRLSAKDVVPTEDVVVTLDDAPPALVVGKLADAKNGDTRAVLARAVAHAPAGAAPYHGDVVLALDVSEGQSQASLASQLHLAAATLATLGEDETFALLACDTACAAYPPEGLARPTPDAIDEAHRFLAALEPGGASDPAGALVDAASRLSPHRAGQVVLLSDGTATAGELAVTSQLAHAAPAVAALDVRVVGVGRAVDDRGLAALARGLGATYDRLATGAPLTDRVRQLAEARRVPVVRDARAPLPAGAVEAEPADATPTRDGDEVVGLARLPLTPTTPTAPTTPTVHAPDAVTVDAGARVARLWARARVAELEQHGDEANAEITSLAVRHHLLSRTTSLLVLENDRMFAELGIPRTVGPTDGPRATGGDGASAGEGFGSGHGRLSGSHMTRPPSVRMGSTMVSGRLPPEVVQRIVRQNFGRFRFCYEQGLRRDATLAGRVTVRFVIGRDGAVAAVGDGGSDLPDARVVACVVSAFSGLSFPQPEGGIVTVIYPIVFSDGSGGGPRPESAQRVPVPTSRPTSWQDLGARLPRNSALNPPPWEPPPPELPTVTHRAGDDRWLGRRPASLEQTLARVSRDPARRQGHVQLVRELLSAGRMDEAYVAAQRFVELDPELPAARETLAEAAAAAFHPREATRAMAAAAALDRRSTSRQLGAMRAALASGDTRRACAHARALGELAPKDHAARAAACRESGTLSVPETATLGFEARSTCDAGACPDVVVITPGGRVLSRWTVGSTGLAAIAGPLVGGTYRTLVVSAGSSGQGTVTVRALGTTLTVPADGTRRTAIVSDVTIPAPRYYPRIRI